MREKLLTIERKGDILITSNAKRLNKPIAEGRFASVGVIMDNFKVIGMEHMKFSFDKELKPAAIADSGDVLVFETEDANCGLIAKETDIWPEFNKIYEKAGGCNPVTGPIYINGAKPGDALSVEILEVEPGFIKKDGYTSIQSGVGSLENITATIQEPLEAETRILKLEGDTLVYKLKGNKECLKIKTDAFVGTIGVAPKHDRRSSFYKGQEWCGNVDCADVKPGATVLLPVNVEGAMFSIGDVHGVQGDGEITGCAMECQGRIKVRITLIDKQNSTYLNWPQVDDKDYIGVISIAHKGKLSDAMINGYVELAKRLKNEYGIELCDGYMLLNLAGVVRIGNGGSCVCKIPREILKKHNIN